MTKKLIICALVILALFTGCEARDKDTVDKSTVNNNIEDYRDPETGVHYLVYNDYYQGGMSVRYNTDGTIMVD